MDRLGFIVCFEVVVFCVQPNIPSNTFSVHVINIEQFQIYKIQSNNVLNLHSLIYHNDNPNNFIVFRFVGNC